MLGSYSLLKICYLCLSDGDEDLRNVFSEDEDHIILMNKIEYLISPDLLMLEPENPESICSSCFRKLNLFYEFKQSCLENGRRLKKFINNIKASDNENDISNNSFELMTNEDTLASTSDVLIPKEEIDDVTGTIDKNSKEKDTEFCEESSNDCNEVHVDSNQENCLENEDEDSETSFELIISEDEDLITKEEIDIVSENKVLNSEEEIMYFSQKSNEDNNKVHVDTNQECTSFNKNQDNCIDMDVQEINDDDEYLIGDAVYIKEEFTALPNVDHSNIYKEMLVSTENDTTDMNMPELDETNLNTSKEEVNNRVYCANCGKSYKSKKYLIQHFKSHHNTNIQKFECTICNITFKNKLSETTHNELHKVDKNEKNSALPIADDSNELLVPTENETTDTNIAEPDQNNVIEKTTKEEIKTRVNCSDCGKSYKNRKYLIRHIKSPNNRCIEKFECTICNITFKYKSSETRHKEQHELNRKNMKKFNCTECKEGYNKKESLIRHMKYHADVKLFKCSICNGMYLNEQAMLKHKRKHNLPGMNCKICGKVFLSKHFLFKHKQIHSNIKDLKKIKNKLSDKSFQIEDLVLNQVKTNTDIKELQEFKCNICDESFSKNYLLLNHEKSHSNVKVMEENCQKENLLLIQKEKTDSDEKDMQTFECLICGETFLTQQLLFKHKKTHEFKCNICGKCWQTEHALLNHKKYHNYVFPCLFCTKEFNRNCSLVLHMKYRHKFL